MPVTVEVPLHLMLDVEAIDARMDDVSDALTAAVTRALMRSRAEVLEPRGGYLTPELRLPELGFTGPGAMALPADAQARIAACVTDAIAVAAANAGLLEPADAPPPLGDPAAEPVDRERLGRLAGRYVIPGYDGPGTPTPIAVDPGTAAAPAPPTTTIRIARWRTLDPLPPESEWGDLFVEACATHPPQLGVRPLVGLMFRSGAGFAIRVVALGPERSLTSDFDVLPGMITITDLYTQAAAASAGGLNVEVSHREAHISTDANISLRWFADLGPEALRREIETFERQTIADAMEPERARLEAALGPDGWEGLVTARVNEAVAALAADQETRSFAMLDADGEKFLLHFHSDVPEVIGGDAIPVVPLISEAMVDPDTARALAEQGLGDESDEYVGDREDGPAHGRGAGSGGGRSAQGGDGRPGWVLGGGADGTSPNAPVFPAGASPGSAPTCESFLGEPSVADLGADGEQLRQEIAEICGRLDIAPCEFAANFCINAARVILARADAIGYASAEDANGLIEVPFDALDVGNADFQNAAAPARQLLRHLASTVPRLNALSTHVVSVYRSPDHRGAIDGETGEPLRWMINYLAAFNSAINYASAELYGAMCQVLMAQLLRTSRFAIYDRQNQIVEYAAMFERVMLPRLERIDELMRWRTAISDYRARQASQALVRVYQMQSPAWQAAHQPPPAASPANTWVQARQDLVDSLRPDGGAIPAAVAGHQRGAVVEVGNDVGVDDGTGRIWTTADIEAALVTRRGALESIDPLIKQFSDLPEVMDRLRGGHAHVVATLNAILDEMLGHNWEILQNVRGDWHYAFRISHISDDVRHATVPGTSIQMGGIHLMAHRALGDAFEGDLSYVLGLNSLFGGELSRQYTLTAIELGGLIVASILCAPLGVVLGIAAAAYHYSDAVEREHIYGALIDPELVLTRAEVEATLFAARIGLALSFIPVVGPLTRAGSTVVRTVAVEGLTEAADAAAASARQALSASGEEIAAAIGRSLTRETAEALKYGLLVALMREVATVAFVNKLVETAMAPVIAYVEREVLVTGPQGGLDRALEHRLALLPRAPGVAD